MSNRSIDERLEFLVQSTESLHATMHELHGMMREHDERMRAQSERESRHRKAIMRGMLEYLTALDEDEGKNGDGVKE